MLHHPLLIQIITKSFNAKTIKCPRYKSLLEICYIDKSSVECIKKFPYSIQFVIYNEHDRIKVDYVLETNFNIVKSKIIEECGCIYQNEIMIFEKPIIIKDQSGDGRHDVFCDVNITNGDSKFRWDSQNFTKRVNKMWCKVDYIYLHEKVKYNLHAIRGIYVPVDIKINNNDNNGGFKVPKVKCKSCKKPNRFGRFMTEAAIEFSNFIHSLHLPIKRLNK